MCRNTLLSGACLLLFILSFGQIPEAFSQKITIVESGVKLSDYQKSDIHRAVQSMYDYYNSVFECGDIALNILIFGDQKQFLTYQQEKISSVISTSGYYSQQTNSIVVSASGSYVETIFHEACHAILLQTFPSAPPWIYEGMAEYFENGTVRGEKFIIGKNKEAFGKIKVWEQKGMIHLGEFLGWPNDKWKFLDQGNWFSRYVSHGLVYFLMEKHPAVMKEVLRQLSNRQTSYQAMNSAYPGGVETLEQDFQKYWE